MKTKKLMVVALVPNVSDALYFKLVYADIEKVMNGRCGRGRKGDGRGRKGG